MNKWLKGNGYWCPSCDGTGRGAAQDRIEYEGGVYVQFYALCPTCGGSKRLAATAEEVMAGVIPVMPPPEPSCLLPIIEYGKITLDRSAT